jgi:hypothetical protein
MIRVGAYTPIVLTAAPSAEVRGRPDRMTLDRREPPSVWAMTEPDELDALSSAELHDLAVRRARRHLDVAFFWQLMQVLPAAETAAGDFDQAQLDIQRISAHVDDLTESGRGEVADLLRPFYLDYLRRHGVRPG